MTEPASKPVSEDEAIVRAGIWDFRDNMYRDAECALYDGHSWKPHTWASARRWIDERKEAIRLVEEEVALLKGHITTLASDPFDLSKRAWSSILAARQEHLETLKRGMK